MFQIKSSEDKIEFDFEERDRVQGDTDKLPLTLSHAQAMMVLQSMVEVYLEGEIFKDSSRDDLGFEISWGLEDGYRLVFGLPDGSSFWCYPKVEEVEGAICELVRAILEFFH